MTALHAARWVFLILVLVFAVFVSVFARGRAGR